MNRSKEFSRHLTWSIFKAVALSILFFFAIFRLDAIGAAFQLIMKVLSPFIIGGAIAYILKPACNFFETHLKKKLPKAAHALSVIVTVILAICAVFILLLLIVPSLLRSVYSIALAIPGNLQSFSDWLQEYAGSNEMLSNYIEGITDNISESLPTWLYNKILPNLQAMVGNVSTGMSNIINGFKNFFIGLIVTIYLLLSRKTFARQAKKLLYALFRESWADAILEEVCYADQVFSGFISGRLLDSLIVGIICAVCMRILNMPYLVPISVIVGITNIIPFFGPFIGAVPSFLLILMVNPIQSLIFLVFILILQQFDGNILGPRILGNVTGLSSFWVLFAIMFFGGVFGFIGTIIGVPVFAVIYDIIRKVVNYKIQNKHISTQKLQVADAQNGTSVPKNSAEIDTNDQDVSDSPTASAAPERSPSKNQNIQE